MADEPLPIPEEELEWKYVRSSGPGGQNVNKVASKAVLAWNFAASPLLSLRAKDRLVAFYPRYIVQDGWLQISSQSYRDQDRNRQDCLDKLQRILAEARKEPKIRRATRPTRGSKMRRLTEKKRRSDTKASRRMPHED
jgi:ribosome-associated protein